MAKYITVNTNENPMAMKPKWYHLLNWSDPEIQEKIWKHLPEEVKKELVELGLAPKELLNQ